MRMVIIAPVAGTRHTAERMSVGIGRDIITEAAFGPAGFCRFIPAQEDLGLPKYYSFRVS
jgi:hypothetical protein